VGTDRAILFDKRLCDTILTLDAEGLARLALAEQSRLSLFDPTRQTNLAIKKEYLILDLCLLGRELALDYYACYVEVFEEGDPEGSIPDRKMLPHIQQQMFLLLLPKHLDRMIASLEKNRVDVRIMSEADIAQLKAWRDRCTADPGYMVAYLHDV
jgi:hypothetical protein